MERHCDGDWEHEFGMKIDTLDNPGWSVEVDLAGTELEGLVAETSKIDRSDADWLHWWSDGTHFYAAAGVTNLGEAVDAFQAFVEAAPPSIAGPDED